MIGRVLAQVGSVLALATATAGAGAQDLADKFGALPAVSSIALSPDGKRASYVEPRGRGAATLVTVDLATGDATPAMATDGKPLQLSSCNWVATTRLICRLSAQLKAARSVAGETRLVAVDADGKNVKLVTRRQSDDAAYTNTFGGTIADLLPDEDGSVLIGQTYIPESRSGTLVSKQADGYALNKFDTRTGRSERYETPKRDAVEYITDGHGNVRIMGLSTYTADGYTGPVVNYVFRAKGSRDWKPLGSYDGLTKAGFNPYAVDPVDDVVYGLKKLDGRQALYSVKLDDSLASKLVLSDPNVDIDEVRTIGRDRKVVGASVLTDVRRAVYFDGQVGQLVASLHKALPMLAQIEVIDASVDRGTMLVHGSSDTDPGSYFLFEPKARRLNKIIVDRPQLEGMKLATVRPVTYPAADGTMVPGYLTLPPGKETARGLPAIVLPHGGPDARDEWGFDWLSQYYAAAGYAVLQPNFRGSGGYGDAWFRKNGYQSWRVAIGDVVDAGRWLIAQGIAAPDHLAIVGWSYGGYAALQSAVIAPDLFKAVVAIAPVTDFGTLIEQQRAFMDFRVSEDRIGHGPHLVQGSPAQNVPAIKAPVLLFHGDMDQNVAIEQSQMMDSRLRSAGKPSQLVVYPGLAHSLIDGTTRADMLRKSDAFLRTSMKM